MAYPKKWNDPAFVEITAYLIDNGVKLPSLEKIGLYNSGEEKLFQRFVRDNRIQQTRGRQATCLSIKNAELRKHLLTALCFYNRQDLPSAIKNNDLPRVIVTAYKYFCAIHNVEVNGTKLTLDRFILAVTSEEYSEIEIEVCQQCDGKYIRSGYESNVKYGCLNCADARRPLFTSAVGVEARKKIA